MSTLMNFDNLIYYDLMTGLYRLIRFLLILIFRLWPYSPHYVIQYVEEFKNHSVETVSEISQKSNVEVVNLGKTKNVIKK